mmetsp:Transcript_42739/g.65649  ORF Transcript_42739/g.65649 Transcript_42739/m.65649 type:complete len:172 (+) Transcript_42739:1567-2082(+)
MQESSELQSLKLDHTKLGAQAEGLADTIKTKDSEIEKLQANLSSQKEETQKYKDKKIQFKDNFKSSQDEIGRNQSLISDLEKRLVEKEAAIEGKVTEISTKRESIEVLQTKLKETQRTLLSNNSTIDELKSSLAEAQKYSFRAILNNRNSTHHPATNSFPAATFQEASHPH